MAKLRAVGDDEKAPAPPKIISVLDAAERGTFLDELIQVRIVIARALDSVETTPTALAALSRRHLEISKEIESLKRQQAEEAAKNGGTADESWSAEAI